MKIISCKIKSTLKTLINEIIRLSKIILPIPVFLFSLGITWNLVSILSGKTSTIEVIRLFADQGNAESQSVLKSQNIDSNNASGNKPSNIGIAIDQVDKTIQSKPEVLTDDSTANNFEIVSDKDLKSDLTQKFIKSRYKKSALIEINGKSTDCFIKNSKFEGDGDFSNKYCVNIVKISKDEINESIFIYAVETGAALDENMQFNSSHSTPGLVKFYKFEEINKDYKLVSESDDIQSGSYGLPPDLIKNYRIGDGSGLGWITILGDMHQGYEGSRIDIYASKVNRIKSIGNLQIESSDVEACNDPDGCDSTSLSTKIETIPANDKKYYDLSTITTGTIIRNKVEEKINRKILVKFDEKKFNYVTDKFTKVYEGHEEF